MENIKEKTADEIKRIEEIIKDLKEHIEFEDYEQDTLDECEKTIKALENILKRYKELEEENSSIKYLNEGLRLDKNILTDMVNDLQEQKRKLEVENKTLKETEPVSIPISVIQNKIDELEEVFEFVKTGKSEFSKGQASVLERIIKMFEKEILEKGNK